MGTVLLVPMVVFAASFAHQLMRCRITGVVIETCVCPDEQAPSDPRLADQSCCQRESIEGISVARVSTDLVEMAAPPPVAERLLPVVPRLRLRATRFVISVHATGPPLVLLKQSFLI